jgi:hypothetical protein
LEISRNAGSPDLQLGGREINGQQTEMSRIDTVVDPDQVDTAPRTLDVDHDHLAAGHDHG